MKEKSIIYLTGGLGNQLFQLAFLHSRKAEYKYVETNLGNPRRNSLNLPDITDFDFGLKTLTIAISAQASITKKSINFVLRNGLNKDKKITTVFWRNISKILASFLVSFHYRKLFIVRQALDNGYYSLRETKFNEFLIGYFQSYRWLCENPKVIQELKKMKLKNPSESLSRFYEDHKYKKSIVVHIRLGDYELDPSLGILDQSYYEASLNYLFSEANYDEILLFSNNLEKAMKMIPHSYLAKIVQVSEFDNRSAETLEAMRIGSAYVIANSTLSWWGAMLSYHEKPSVIAPNPWFKERSDPADLIPNSWKQLSAWPEEEF